MWINQRITQQLPPPPLPLSWLLDAKRCASDRVWSDGVFVSHGARSMRFSRRIKNPSMIHHTACIILNNYSWSLEIIYKNELISSSYIVTSYLISWLPVAQESSEIGNNQLELYYVTLVYWLLISSELPVEQTGDIGNQFRSFLEIIAVWK